MGHAVVVDAARWRALTDAAGLPAPGPLLAAEGTVTVTRADVFAGCDASIAEENAIELFYASLAWGLGTKARQLSTRLSAFAGSLDGARSGKSGAAALLVEAWSAVRDGRSPRECYETLLTPKGAG